MTAMTAHCNTHMTLEQYRKLGDLAEKAGLSRGALVRSWIEGREVRERVPADLPALIRELRLSGSRLEEMLRKAGRSEGYPEEETRQALALNRRAEEAVLHAYGF